MNRRQLLHAFSGMALGASPLVRAASIQRARDEKSVAIIAIGHSGIFTVLSVMEKLPVRIPKIAVGTCRPYLDAVRTDFDQIYCIDWDCLPEHDELNPFHAVDESMWEEVRALLPKEQRWLIVGGLSDTPSSAFMPLISREANQSGRRAQVFAMDPDSACPRAERTRLEVDRWAADCVVVPNTWINGDYPNTFWINDDYFEELDGKFLTWCEWQCKSA